MLTGDLMNILSLLAFRLSKIYLMNFLNSLHELNIKREQYFLHKLKFLFQSIWALLNMNFIDPGLENYWAAAKNTKYST